MGAGCPKRSETNLIEYRRRSYSAFTTCVLTGSDVRDTDDLESNFFSCSFEKNEFGLFRVLLRGPPAISTQSIYRVKLFENLFRNRIHILEVFVFA